MSEVEPAPAPQPEADPEAPSSPTHSKIKEMRRIHQKTQPPTDKSELIKFLSERITQAEDALADTEELLDSEVKERQKISTQIEQRNNQLQKLYEVDQRGLPEKIRQKLTEILTTTVSQKVQAQEKLGDEKSRNYEYKKRYDQLKWEEKNINLKLTEQTSKEEQLNGEIAALEQQNQNHEKQLQEKETSFKEIKEKKETLENKYLQMKVAMDRMGDIKAVLNRFFGNEDLFDQKMELKEQKIQRIQIPSRDTQSRQPAKESRTQTRLKPLNYTKNNDDQDFWRGDYKGKF